MTERCGVRKHPDMTIIKGDLVRTHNGVVGIVEVVYGAAADPELRQMDIELDLVGKVLVGVGSELNFVISTSGLEKVTRQ